MNRMERKWDHDPGREQNRMIERHLESGAVTAAFAKVPNELLGIHTPRMHVGRLRGWLLPRRIAIGGQEGDLQ